MLISILLVLLLILYCHYYIKNMAVMRMIKEIPSPTSFPIFGSALMFMGKPEENLKKVYQFYLKHNKIIAVWLGPWLNIVLFDPKDVELVLKSNKTMDKAYQYEFLKPWLGDSILLSSGEKFRHNKKLVMQSFHANNLKQYLRVFNEQANGLINRLKIHVGQGDFNIHNELSLCTMYSLLETSLGVDKEIIGSDALNYRNAVTHVGLITYMRASRFWLYPEFIFNLSNVKRKQDRHLTILNNLTNRVISQRKIDFEMRKDRDSNDKGKLFVDNFFEAKNCHGEPFSEEEIKDELKTMMFAGQDTTAVSIGFALSLLGMYPDIQDKVVTELNQIFKQSTRSVTYEDIHNLKYLEQVIQETWRLYPPIPLIARTARENIQLDKYTLPRNSTVAIPIILIHRNAEVYPNPNRFNPDHFLPDRIKERHPYSFIPFSCGVRMCIGSKYAMLVIKVVLATILRTYQVRSTRKMKDMALSAHPTLCSKNGFIISLESR